MINDEEDQFQSAMVRASSSKKIEANQIYNEPIYELTEENLSERNTPHKMNSSPRMLNSTNGKLDSDKSKFNQKDRKLLIVTIEIGNGEQEQLTIYENDNPQEIAEEFCNKHNIDRDLQEIICMHIEKSINDTKS